ncbi:MAG: lipocalin-like domain-containing protein [Chloroflexi bacterium]|nr:lipocalin-like domain-containing protein [Chloroflexota bacterium]
MLTNRRFLGAWELVSFESRLPDGSVVRPWGDDPVGIVIWDETGYGSAQLGPRDPAAGPYVAYFGVLEAGDVAAGTMVTRVVAASAPRLRSDQVREFRFLNDDEMTLSPPPGPDGAVSTLLWRRLKA